MNSSPARTHMDSFERHILRKLYRRSCIGARHTALEHCFSGIRRDEVKEAKRAYERLVSEGYIAVKPTAYGIQVSINPARVAAVRRELSE